MTGDRRVGGDIDGGVFHRPVLLACMFAVVTSFILVDLVPRFAPGLLRFEYALADMRTALLSDQLPSQHPDVAVVGITDQTLSDYKIRLPIDRMLLSRLIEAIDAAGAKAIGIDLLFYRTTPADNDEMFINAVKNARAKVVIAAADERLGLSQLQLDKQREFLALTGRGQRLRQSGDRARLGGALQGGPGARNALSQELCARHGGSSRIQTRRRQPPHRLAARPARRLRCLPQHPGGHAAGAGRRSVASRPSRRSSRTRS